MSLQWTSWLAGSHFIHTPGRYSTNFQTGRLHSDVQSLTLSYQHFICFISYHYIFILFHHGTHTIKKWYPFHLHVFGLQLFIPHHQVFSVNGSIIWQFAARLPSFFTHHKILPNFIDNSWLSWIMRGISANQEWTNICKLHVCFKTKISLLPWEGQI